MSTITQVAKAAGVSKATVSRVLSGNTPVKEETRLRVQAAIDELGYSPNQAARSLATNKTFTIGLMASDISSIYYGPAASGIENALRACDRHVILADGLGTLKGERDAVEFLIRRQVDALVMLIHWLPEEEVAAINQRCPVFVMNQHYQGDEGRNVDFDNYAGGRLAAEYLLEKGHKKLAIITGPLWKQDASRRYQGFTDVLAERGIPLLQQVESDFSADGGVLSMNQVLASNDRPTATFCCNDMAAIGAIRACMDQGVRIPEDMAILGFDNVSLSNFLSPRLTTINMPLYEMAQATAQLLLNRVYGAEQPVQTCFKPKLVERESV